MHHNITSHRYYIGLLISLLLVFAVNPFFGEGLASSLLNVALLITLLFSVLVISHSRKLMLLAAVLAAPLVFGSMMGIQPLLGALSGVAFVGLIICVMLKDMFTSTKVDASLIIGSISLYLMLGLMWGFIYLAINHTYPNSFVFADTSREHISELMYFSMVTLTTLGYGDITPLSPPARAMANMQAVAGQIYLTVLVARLVGMHIAQKK